MIKLQSLAAKSLQALQQAKTRLVVTLFVIALRYTDPFQ